MRDVTEIFQNYRLTLRQLWNNKFWGDADLRQDWSLERYFELVKAPLFLALVLAKIEASSSSVPEALANQPWRFSVVPDVPHSSEGTRSAELTMLRAKDSGWDSEGSIGRVQEFAVSLEYVDVFEWGNVGYRDYRYYRVLIAAAKDGPELAGRHALVDVNEVKVLFDDTGASLRTAGPRLDTFDVQTAPGRSGIVS